MGTASSAATAPMSSRRVFTAQNVFLDGSFKPATIVVDLDSGKIAEIIPEHRTRNVDIDAGDKYIIPGLVEYVPPHSSPSPAHTSAAPMSTSTSPAAQTGRASGRAPVLPHRAASPPSSTCPSTPSRPPPLSPTSRKSVPQRVANAGQTSPSGAGLSPVTRYVALAPPSVHQQET